jgi:hypothetical protein
MLSLVTIFLLLAAPDGVRLELGPAGPDVTALRVERESLKGWRQVAELRAIPGKALVYQDPIAPAETRYRVVAVDAVGNLSAPVEVASACRWRDGAIDVPVVCQRACSCSAAVARLALAKAELLKYGLVEPACLARALHGVQVYVVSSDSIRPPRGEDAAGVYVPMGQLVVLTRDMGAALHEMVHAYQEYLERDGEEHAAWDDGVLREIDQRFRSRLSGRPLL